MTVPVGPRAKTAAAGAFAGLSTVGICVDAADAGFAALCATAGCDSAISSGSNEALLRLASDVNSFDKYIVFLETKIGIVYCVTNEPSLRS